MTFGSILRELLAACGAANLASAMQSFACSWSGAEAILESSQRSAVCSTALLGAKDLI
jgi:hypothetical protein